MTVIDKDFEFAIGDGKSADAVAIDPHFVERHFVFGSVRAPHPKASSGDRDDVRDIILHVRFNPDSAAAIHGKREAQSFREVDGFVPLTRC